MSVLGSAARVLNRIDDPRSRSSDAGQQNWKRRRGMTPELRLLREHYDKIGADEAKEAQRLDPSQHKFGCRCAQCDRAPVACPIEECTDTLIGQRALAVHLRWHARAAKKERAEWNALTKSGAIALLRAILGDKDRAATVDMRAIREFSSRLDAAAMQFGGHRRRSKASIRAIRGAIALYEQQPHKLVTLQSRYPADVAALLSRLALLCGVNTSVIVSACSLYGLEALSKALRADKIAPHPHIPGELREKQPQAAFPEADQ